MTRWGMLASVLADARHDFEGFLAFYEKHLNSSGLMSWQLVLRNKQVFVDPKGGGQSSATDGDLDAAYALLLAGAP
jgi:endo-1,4-beta-D-glucanase Y